MKVFLLKRRYADILPLSFFLLIVFLSLITSSPVAFCDSWQPIGPEGGSFVFSITNPGNANEVTAITTSSSSTNVYRSTDAGTSWSKIGEIHTRVSDVSAFDFSTLYAITNNRCYHSIDGGARWTVASLPSLAGWAYRVCADSADSSKVYAAGYIYDYQSYPDTYSMVFFKSTDRGLNWSASSFFTFDYFYPEDMAISKSNPNVIYIAGWKIALLGHYSSGALFKSIDAGESWTDISDSVDTEHNDHFYSVAVDPTDEEKVYVGGDYIYRSIRTGGGIDVSWERRASHPPAHSIRIDPVETSMIYVAGYQYVSISTDYGQSWTIRNDCIRKSAQHIEIAPADPSKVYVASYAGFFKSANSGATWNTAHGGIYAARIAALAVDPSKVIVQNSGKLMTYIQARTATWRNVVTPESCGEVCDILINPDNPDITIILEDYG
ncbi:MAG: hypothetical protein ACYS3S_18010 [Planctomycetota bacterium]|jgi:photosystem II stability/assembly factor-like uncharacterized protein